MSDVHEEELVRRKRAILRKINTRLTRIAKLRAEIAALDSRHTVASFELDQYRAERRGSV